MLEAKFKVDPQKSGVLACGFMVRAADATTFYYVHFDRSQAILVRSGDTGSWNEIKRVGYLDKPAGRWHLGQLECAGDTLKVSLNGKLLYEAKDAKLKRGRIGFYAQPGTRPRQGHRRLGQSSNAERGVQDSAADVRPRLHGRRRRGLRGLSRRVPLERRDV